MYIDTHCHLDFDVFKDGLATLLQRAESVGVVKLVVPGVTAQNWARIDTLAQQHPDRIYPAYGLHPCFLESHSKADIDKLEAFCVAHRVIAIGEIGLDFFIPEAGDPGYKKQQWLFKEQVEIAKRLNLPLLIHCRKAHDQCLKTIKDSGFQRGGIIHAYSGSLEQAKRYLGFGFKLGVGGGATYDRAKKLHKILKALPLSSFVLETDAPDIPPCFARGEPNSPVNLPKIAELIANHTGIGIDDLAEQTSKTAAGILSI